MATGGIGIVLERNQAGRLCIVDLVPDSPAYLCSRIHRNDVLTKVDGIDVSGWDIAFVKSLIIGPVGTPIVLGLDRGGPILTYIRVERAASLSTADRDAADETVLLVDGSGSSAIVCAVVSHLRLESSVKVVHLDEKESDNGCGRAPQEASRLGMWPVLLRGGTKISGPAAVSRYLARGSTLNPMSALEDAQIAQWCSHRNYCLSFLSNNASRGAQPAYHSSAPRSDVPLAKTAHGDVHGGESAAAGQWDAVLRDLNEHLSTRSYAVGGRLTLADLALFTLVHPAVRRLASLPLAARNDGGGGGGGGGDSGGVGASKYLRQHVPHLARWFDHVQHLPAVRRVFPATVPIDTSFDVPLPFRPRRGAAAGP